MTNSNNHHGEGEVRGGHEIEGIDAGLLFRVTFGLSAVTLIASIFVGQWFYRQRAELAEQRASVDDKVLLKSHRKEMQELLNGISSTINDVHSRQLLDAQPAPPGWIHPDDIGKPAPAAEPAPAPTDPAAVPAVPADPTKPAAAAPSDAAKPTDGAKPNEAAPAADAKPAAAPAADAKPAAAEPAKVAPTK